MECLRPRQMLIPFADLASCTIRGETNHRKSHRIHRTFPVTVPRLASMMSVVSRPHESRFGGLQRSLDRGWRQAFAIAVAAALTSACSAGSSESDRRAKGTAENPSQRPGGGEASSPTSTTVVDESKGSAGKPGARADEKNRSDPKQDSGATGGPSTTLYMSSEGWRDSDCEAKPGESAQETLTRCHKESQTAARNRDVERVSWEDAKAWFPYRPLLRATTFPREPLTEAVFAGSATGGRRGDPRTEHSGVQALYQPSSASADTSSWQQVIAAGGIDVSTTSLLDPPPPIQGSTKSVTVRGQTVKHTEMSQFSLRFIWWDAPRPGGGTIRVAITADLRTYTERELVAFANSLADA